MYKVTGEKAADDWATPGETPTVQPAHSCKIKQSIKDAASSP